MEPKTTDMSRLTTVTAQIDAAIAEAGGNARNALNNALASRDAAMTLLQAEGDKVITLMIALEEIRAVVWPPRPPGPTETLRTISEIVRDALAVAGGEPATPTTKED